MAGNADSILRACRRLSRLEGDLQNTNTLDGANWL